MIKSVGIDFHQGKHVVRCLDERAQLYDSFNFQTTPEGLATLEEHIFRDGSNPVIVFEPAGLTWFIMAICIRARHPDCRLVRAKGQKVAALRRYLRGSSKSDRLDALTLAKMPFIDPEQLDEVYLPPAKIHALQRLARQRKRLESDIGARKTRIGAIVESYVPGVRKSFSDPWSAQARAFLRYQLNPMSVACDGEKALHSFLTKTRYRNKTDKEESHRVFLACQSAADLYRLSSRAEAVDDEFFSVFQEEIERELRLLELEEAESEAIAKRMEEMYLELHPSDNLRSIPGVGRVTAPVFLATVGDPIRFHNQSAFSSWAGVVPRTRQSSEVEAKGLKMTKAGPAIMKWALFQAGDIGRRFDPQLAALYYREMVHHGKNHKQAMGAVMSHLAARVIKVLQSNRPYELRDNEGKAISQSDAKKLILHNYQVPENIRRERRRRNPVKRDHFKSQGTALLRTNEAAIAPQPAKATIPESV
jgi:transposase